MTSQASETQGLYEATRVASVPAADLEPRASIRAIGGVASALAPVAFDEILALIGHAMLDGDAAAERGDAIDDCGREIVSAWSKNQLQPVERDVLVDLLEHVERARDGFVVGRVQPPRPAVLRRGCG